MADNINFVYVSFDSNQKSQKSGIVEVRETHEPAWLLKRIFKAKEPHVFKYTFVFQDWF
jgi:hypothetical protein